MGVFKNNDKSAAHKVLDIIDTYNITIQQFKEHLTSLQFNPSKIDYFATISTNIKTYFTKIYNQKHLSSLKPLKKNDRLQENDYLDYNNDYDDDDDHNDNDDNEDDIDKNFNDNKKVINENKNNK